MNRRRRGCDRPIPRRTIRLMEDEWRKWASAAKVRKGECCARARRCGAGGFWWGDFETAGEEERGRVGQRGLVRDWVRKRTERREGLGDELAMEDADVEGMQEGDIVLDGHAGERDELRRRAKYIGHQHQLNHD